jgi:hypothetical protein
MALCPFAVQKPVSAHGGPIGTILGAVIHVTAGEGDPYNEFANPANQVSSHFGIGNGQGGMADGLIEQYVDTSMQSWAQMAGNANYLSVETEGEPTNPLTTNQLLSFARLYVWMYQTHGIPLVITDTPGQRGFITHGDGGVAWGDHIDCPGPQRSAQRSSILYIASLALNPSPPPTAVKETNMLTHDPKSNGYWGARPNASVYTFDGAPYIGPHATWAAAWGIGTVSNPVVGIAADGVGGFALLTDNGGSQPEIYNIPANGEFAGPKP